MRRALGLTLCCCVTLIVSCRSATDVPERPPWLNGLAALDDDDDSGGAAVEADPAPAAGDFAPERAAPALRRRLLLEEGLPLALQAQEQQPLRDEDGVLVLGLLDILAIAARNDAEYQDHKESVFQAALALDLADEDFLDTWQELISSSGFRDGRARASVRDVTVQLALDLSALLEDGGPGGEPGLADRSFIAPMLRRADEFVLTAPLAAGQRDVVHALFELERHKSLLAARVAGEYYTTLQTLQETQTHEARFRWLIGASRRARRMTTTDQGPAAPSDPTLLGEMAARQEWIAALDRHDRQQQRLMRLIGLPPATAARLDLSDLSALDEAARARWVEGSVVTAVDPGDRPDPRQAVLVGLAHRLDLRVAVGRVFDARRALLGPLDNTRADQTLLGSVALAESLGAEAPDGALVAPLDLSVSSVRQHRHQTDDAKEAALLTKVRRLETVLADEVREGLGRWGAARERLVTELQASLAAQRRVAASNEQEALDDQAVLDGLEARDLWVLARNSYAAELVRHRIAELELQRDLGLLTLDERGLRTLPLGSLQ